MSTFDNRSAPDSGQVVWSVSTKSHPAGPLTSNQPGGPPCWANPLAFGLIGKNVLIHSLSMRKPSKLAIYTLQAANFVHLRWPRRRESPAERPIWPLGPLVGSICVKDLQRERFKKLRKSELSDILHFFKPQKSQGKIKKYCRNSHDSATSIDFNYMSPNCSFHIFF